LHPPDGSELESLESVEVDGGVSLEFATAVLSVIFNTSFASDVDFRFTVRIVASEIQATVVY